MSIPRFFPWLALAVGVVLIGWAARPEPRRSPFDLQSFAAIPVSAEGRVKPIDTVARNTLMVLSGLQALRLESGSVSSTQWLLELVTHKPASEDYKIFLVEHPQVLALLQHPEAESGRQRVSFKEIWPHREPLMAEARKVQDIKPKERDPYQKQLSSLFGHLNMYVAVRDLIHPFSVPPIEPGESWRPMTEAFEELQKTGKPSAAAASLAGIFQAYERGDAASFNLRVSEHLDLIGKHLPHDVRRARFEVFFNRFQPFYQTTILYTVVALLLCFSWLGWSAPLRRAALGLLVLALVVHSFGLIARIYLQGRPPVTNLYSSAIFIGWACILLALAVEWFTRNGLGIFSAAVIGLVTTIIAHNLATGDTMEMMQAVLDTNFWLATHVVAVTIGYSATFLAGFLAIVFIFRGVFTRTLTPEVWKSLGKAIYGVICFAMLFSFVGTVLGGIWADQSWGRFWGWDPKENGAALIVAMNALILHARWGGLVQQRGVAVLAVAGNIVTAWSWFGTNMLGVGLHSYGFMDSAVFWILLFVASQLVVIGIGLTPTNLWRSVREPVPGNVAAPVRGRPVTA